MNRKEAIENLKEFIDTYITCRGEEDTVAVSLDNVDVEALDMAIKALEQEPTTKNNLGIEPQVSLDTYKQVCKERDIAIDQLHELGYEFGEKICIDKAEDCISRKLVIAIIQNHWCY